jgi:endonuclease III
MISSQTKDEVTSKAIKNLQKIGLDIKTILETPKEEIEQSIYPASFYKRKAEYILETTKTLHEKYNDDIPDNANDLKKLKGVGPKMAYIAMNVCWKKNVGIG